MGGFWSCVINNELASTPKKKNTVIKNWRAKEKSVGSKRRTVGIVLQKGERPTQLHSTLRTQSSPHQGGKLGDVVGGGAGAGEGADEIALLDDNVRVTAHLNVGASDAELVVKHGVALLDTFAVGAELGDVACYVHQMKTR